MVKIGTNNVSFVALPYEVIVYLYRILDKGLVIGLCMSFKIKILGVITFLSDITHVDKDL